MTLSKQKLAIIILVGLAFAVYANTLWNNMFWDDNDFILNNQYVQNFQFDKFFTENVIAGAGFGSNYWRPVLLTVFSLEYHIFHSWSGGYHLVNLLFHAADAVLLFLILSFLFRNYWVVLLTSIIFVVHPVQTEAVSYANSLGDSLSVFFILLGTWLYLKEKRALALLMYPFALMSKETAIVMPGLIFLVSLFNTASWKRSFLDIWKYLAVSGIYIALRATSLNFINTFNLYNESNSFTESIAVRIFTFFKSLLTYFGLLFWPQHLHMERTIDFAVRIDGPVVLGGALFIFLIFIAVLLWKKIPAVSFGILWFFIALAPMSNIVVPINGLIYEHWLYLPLVGIFLALITLLYRFFKVLGAQKLGLALFVIVSLAFAGRAVARNLEWHDAITFYTQTLKYSPGSYRVNNNLGMAYADEKNYEKAEEYYILAINIEPSNAVAYYNLGNNYRDSGKGDLAIESYENALAVDPSFPFTYSALVNAYFESKEFEKARALLEKYLKDHPNEVETLISLGQIAILQEDYSGAVSYLEKALALDPRNTAAQNMYIQAKSKL